MLLPPSPPPPHKGKQAECESNLAIFYLSILQGLKDPPQPAAEGQRRALQATLVRSSRGCWQGKVLLDLDQMTGRIRTF